MSTSANEFLKPVSWYPRIDNATAAERKNWQLIGAGHGIHWKDVDEDISV